MHKWRAIILFFVCGCAVGLAQTTNEESGITVEANEGAVFDLKTGLVTATNGVTIRYKEAVLTAREASWSESSGEVVARGDVRLQRGAQLLVADNLQYNFLTRKMLADNFKFGQPPYLAQSDVMVGNQAANVYVGAAGLVTTDDYAEPAYSIHAKNLIIVPGEYIVAKNATLHLGNVPIFYYPYYRRSLKHRSNHFTTMPG